jgi:hypothetical protein
MTGSTKQSGKPQARAGLQGQDAQGRTSNIAVFAGDYKNHPGMDIDLLAKLCRAGDALKLLRIQQLLYNQEGNMFDQNSRADLHTFGRMMCGAVAKGRAIELFGNVNLRRAKAEAVTRRLGAIKRFATATHPAG